MTRLPLLLAAILPCPALAQSAPPLTDLSIVSITSPGQAERIAAGQQATARQHRGPVTLVVRETGIGGARVVRIDGAVIAPPSSTRPLCGAAVTPGACRPGEAMTGLEVTYHLGEVRRGTTVTVQDISANLPARTLTAVIRFD